MKLHEIVDNEPMIYPLLQQLLAKKTPVHMLTWGSQDNIVTDVKLVRVNDPFDNQWVPSLEIYKRSVDEDGELADHESITSFRVPEMSDRLELKKVDGNWRVIYPDFEPLDDHETE